MFILNIQVQIIKNGTGLKYIYFLNVWQLYVFLLLRVSHQVSAYAILSVSVTWHEWLFVDIYLFLILCLCINFCIYTDICKFHVKCICIITLWKRLPFNYISYVQLRLQFLIEDTNVNFFFLSKTCSGLKWWFPFVDVLFCKLNAVFWIFIFLLRRKTIFGLCLLG